MNQIPCPDGYLLDASSPLAAGHHDLNQYLLRAEEAGWQTAMKEVNAIRDKARKLLIWRALIERVGWLGEHNSTSECLGLLRGLAERIEKWTLAPSERDLIDILNRTGAVAQVLAPYTPMPHLLDYLETYGLTPEMAVAIRQFRERVLERSMTVNQVSLQMFRSRLDMLSWRDEWDKLDLQRCWSEQIRADFRAMKGDERENWRRLLYSINGDEGVRPAPKWMSNAEMLMGLIGLGSFRTQLLTWFLPLQPGRAQKLSREGSFLLRAFIWMAESLKDAEVLARVAEIGRVDFKPKANGTKVVRAAAAAVGQPDPTPPKPVAPVSFDALIARSFAAVFAPGSSALVPDLAKRIDVAGDFVNVRGSLDSYRVHISTGSIFRQSDGKRIEIADREAAFDNAMLPDFGGVSELMRDILVLAQDAEHKLIARDDGE